MNDHCGCKIAGIKCDVKNCVHHTVDDCCDAGCIKVESSNATEVRETMCATFECKD